MWVILAILKISSRKIAKMSSLGKIHPHKYAKIFIWENKSLKKLVSLKSFKGVKYVMLRHIFVIQKFSSFVKLLEHYFWQYHIEIIRAKFFYFLEKSVATLPFFYILKVHLTYLNEPSRVVAKNQIFERFFSMILQKFCYNILAEHFWMTLSETLV